MSATRWSMKRLAYTIAMLSLCVFVAPTIASAQKSDCWSRTDSCHLGGRMAMSPDAKYIAYFVTGMPATEFALLDTQTHKVTIVQAPEGHRQLDDIGWSPDGDEMTFVTSERSVLGGYGEDVWRLRPDAGGSLVVDLLARIPNVRRPVLSRDGTKLATFERVFGPTDTFFGTFGLFERNLETGKPIQRSRSYWDVPWALQYDLNDSLVMSVYQPKFAGRFPKNIDPGERFMWLDRDLAGRNAQSWESEIGRVWSFRIVPGDSLAAWPKPFPEHGAPEGARAVRPLNDGRVIVVGSLDASNTRGQNLLRGYGSPGQRPGPLKYDYIAYGADGAGEILPSVRAPDGSYSTGGADIAGDGQVFAQILSDNIPLGAKTAAEMRDWDSRDTLSIYRGGKLVFESLVTKLAEGAPVVRLSPSGNPIMPIQTEPHRVAAPPKSPAPPPITPVPI